MGGMGRPRVGDEERARFAGRAAQAAAVRWGTRRWRASAPPACLQRIARHQKAGDLYLRGAAAYVAAACTAHHLGSMRLHGPHTGRHAACCSGGGGGGLVQVTAGGRR